MFSEPRVIWIHGYDCIKKLCYQTVLENILSNHVVNISQVDKTSFFIFSFTTRDLLSNIDEINKNRYAHKAAVYLICSSELSVLKQH